MSDLSSVDASPLHYINTCDDVLSRKFCSAENFGPGPFFSEKIVPGETIFPENFVPVYAFTKTQLQ